MRSLIMLSMILLSPVCSEKPLKSFGEAAGKAAGPALIPVSIVVAMFSISPSRYKVVDTLCDRFVHCEVYKTKEECRKYLPIHTLSRACKIELLRYPTEYCPIFPSKQVHELCFPPCSDQKPKCYGETLAICKNGSEYRFDCYNYCGTTPDAHKKIDICGYDALIGHNDCLCE